MVRPHSEFGTMQNTSESFECFYQCEEFEFVDQVVLLGRIPFTQPESNDLGIIWIEPLVNVSATSGQTSIGRDPDRQRFLHVVEGYSMLVPMVINNLLDLIECSLRGVVPMCHRSCSL